MRSIRPFLDQMAMINIYYTFFYPHLIYGIEFWGQAADTHLNEINISQAALRIILKIQPWGYVSAHFRKLNIMPVKMAFEYRFLILFLNSLALNEISIQLKNRNKTRSKNIIEASRACNRRGERSLTCTGVHLYNKYLSGVEAHTSLGLRGELVRSMWAFGVRGGAV